LTVRGINGKPSKIAGLVFLTQKPPENAWLQNGHSGQSNGTVPAKFASRHSGVSAERRKLLEIEERGLLCRNLVSLTPRFNAVDAGSEKKTV